MSKARDLANAGTALTSVSATELGYLDGVTSAVQTQVDAKIAKSTVTTKGDLLVATGSGTVVRQGVGTDGQFLKANSAQADGVEWATVSQYALPSQTGNSGKFLTTNGTAESWGTVNQPITWTGRASTTYTVYQIDYNGSLYVMAAGNGTVYTSPDGITWTARTVSGFTTNAVLTVRWVSFLNLWIAGGDNNCLATSTDGVTWTARTANMGAGNQINHINDNGSVILGVGRGGGTTNTGGIIYSTDGINWTRKSQSITVGPSYRMSAWNGTNWIVVSGHSTNNYLYASTPSGTWTAGADGSAQDLGIIYWDGTRHIVTNSSQRFRYSTSLTLGTTTVLEGAVSTGATGEQAKQYASYYNGRIYYAYQAYCDFSTAFGADNTIYITNKTLVPGGTQTTDQITYHWVGSTGRIMVSQSGIFTSF